MAQHNIINAKKIDGEPVRQRGMPNNFQSNLYTTVSPKKTTHVKTPMMVCCENILLAIRRYSSHDNQLHYLQRPIFQVAIHHNLGYPVKSGFSTGHYTTITGEKPIRRA